MKYEKNPHFPTVRGLLGLSQSPSEFAFHDFEKKKTPQTTQMVNLCCADFILSSGLHCCIHLANYLISEENHLVDQVSLSIRECPGCIRLSQFGLYLPR